MKDSTFKQLVEILLNAKKSLINAVGGFVRKHPIYRFPMFIGTVICLFFYDLLISLSEGIHMKKRLSQAVAASLVFSLIVTNVAVPTLAAYDDTSGDSVSENSEGVGEPEESASESVVFGTVTDTVNNTIISFQDLPNAIKNQTLYVGDMESDIVLPASLEAVLEKAYANGENNTANSVDEQAFDHRYYYGDQ